MNEYEEFSVNWKTTRMLLILSDIYLHGEKEIIIKQLAAV